MTSLMYIVVATGLTASVVALVLAVARGRMTPPHRVPWIIGLVVLGLDTAIHVAASIGMLVAGAATETLWFYLGTLGFVALLATAIVRPRLAALVLLGSALAVPLMFGIGGLVTSSGERADMPWQVAAMTYSVPAVLSGSLLLSSALRKRVVPPVTQDRLVGASSG